MTKKRIFRCCISFLVICCVLFNFVTVPARAAATAIASGIIALLFSIGMGIVAVDLTMQAIGGYHTSLEKAGIELYQNDVDKQSEFLTWIQNLGKDSEDGIIETTDTVRDAIRHWGAGLMTGEVIEFESTLEDGCVSYNGVVLSNIPYVDRSVYPYCIMFMPSSEYISVVYSKQPFVVSTSSTVVLISSVSTGTISTRLTVATGEWSALSKYTSPAGSVYLNPASSVFFSDYDLVWRTDSSLYLAASEPVLSKTESFSCSVFVGDIPGKIQSGEADEDQIYVPERLNITQILTGEVDDLEAVNKISTQLAEGTLTYEQYLEMTQVKDDTQAGTDVWVPPSDPGIYALDLTSYFPFCIPFDLFDFFSCLAADPVAPVIHWEVALPGGSSMPVDIDLSPFDSVAQLLRRLQLLLFAVGLAIKTRDLIRG